MRHSLILTLSLLALLLGCNEDGYTFFRFVTPAAEGELTPEASEFELRVPAGTQLADVQVWVDGVAVPAGSLALEGATVTGPLGSLASGDHVVTAELPFDSVFYPRVLRAERSFRMAGASFTVNESVEQLQVTRAAPGVGITLRDASGAVVMSDVTDYQGSHIFRPLAPGPGYTVELASTPPEVAGPFEVMSVESSRPPQSFYDAQVIDKGYGYIETRDGTKLSVVVTFPGPPEAGPFPTVINLSGYDPSQPTGPLVPENDPNFSFLNGICNLDPELDPLDILCDGPTHPTGLVAGLLGYATVGVNLRGTACSGGAYDFYDTLQVLDGYDVVETIAAQPWVKDGRVGVVGLSFPGITSLFVAKSQPPSLAAITPLSVIANTALSTLTPGGIFNDGFALEWATTVLNRADPFGHGWEAGQVAQGDTVCEENQLLHSQKVDIIAKARSSVFYPPEIADPVSPELFADQILVPVFTTGSWQDEQTGGHFPSMWDDYTSSPIVRFQAFNGAHSDGLAPHTLQEWKLFLDFYVARERLPVPIQVSGLAPLLFQFIFGGPIPLPLDRVNEFAAYATFEEALAAYEAEDPVRILFESGAGDPDEALAPVETFEARFAEWPPPETEPRRFWLQPDGSLREAPPLESDSASLFRHDAAKGQETTINLDGGPAPASFLWPGWQAGRQAVFVSDPLVEDLAMVGHASADLFVRGGAPEAELEVMLSEVRPDGQEAYVQSGWLRASQRALAADATELRPTHDHLEADAAPLSTTEFEEVRVEIFPFGHVFRAGSRIRLSVASPGGNRTRWRFDLTEYEEEVEHAIGHSAEHPSSLVLPVVPGLTPPAALPPCVLRAQPCRTYVPHTNTPD